jgi:Uri superfamily endonuclease
MRGAKPLRWHADYLFSRHPATRAWRVDTELTECELAARLRAATASRAIAGFGAGDCGCAGHLLAVGRAADLDRLLRVLPHRAGRATRASKG